MRSKRVVVHLAWIAALVLVAAGGAASIGSPAAVAPGSAVASVADPVPGAASDADDITPVACRMEPQCSTNADCVVWCGPTGGHCVHNSCPIRICKCS